MPSSLINLSIIDSLALATEFFAIALTVLYIGQVLIEALLSRPLFSQFREELIARVELPATFVWGQGLRRNER